MASLDLGKLAFYWRMTDAPGVPPNPVPDFVEFSFGFRADWQLIIQERRADTLAYLERIYREDHNVGYLQEGHALAAGYGGDFTAFVDASVAAHAPRARRISEIGAGGCYLLKSLKDRGYETAAVDPSPVAKAKGQEYGIEVVPAFYPAPGVIPTSDLIVHYDVLEHVAEPAAFLASHAGDLNPGGLVVFAVPDCTPYLRRGDVSVVLHEHLNYFDEDSLRRVVEAAGLEVLHLAPGRYGGVLQCAARLPDRPRQWTPARGDGKFIGFAQRVGQLSRRIGDFVAEGRAAGNSLGCYVPLRAIPYLSMLGVGDGVRFFDDNPGIHRQYFDGFPIPVENMADLVAAPVSHLLILSFAFGDAIRRRIEEAAPGAIHSILCLSDLDAEMDVPAAATGGGG